MDWSNYSQFVSAITTLMTEGADLSTERSARKNPYLNGGRIEEGTATGKLLLIEVRRTKQFRTHTLGQLFVNSRKVGVTIELPWKENRVDESRIPPKTYSAFTRDGVDRWWRHWRIQLVDVSNRSFIQIHPVSMFSSGAEVSDTKGCIVVGDGVATNGKRLLGSGQDVMDRIEKQFDALKEKNILVQVTESFRPVTASFSCEAADGQWPDYANEPYVVTVNLQRVYPYSELVVKWSTDDPSVRAVSWNGTGSYSRTVTLDVPGSGKGIQDYVDVRVNGRLILRGKVFNFR